MLASTMKFSKHKHHHNTPHKGMMRSRHETRHQVAEASGPNSAPCHPRPRERTPRVNSQCSTQKTRTAGPHHNSRNSHGPPPQTHHPGPRTTRTSKACGVFFGLLRKEVIQPHLPVRLPCYDLVLITSPTFDSSLPQGVGPPASGVADFHDLTGGVYKARERIHRSVADLRLLATPTSWGRVADPNPN